MFIMEKKIYLCLYFFAYFIQSLQGLDLSARRSFPLISSNTYVPSQDCPQVDACVNEPRGSVCAGNGNTYDTWCDFLDAKCNGVARVTFKHFGECRPREKCEDQRRYAVIKNSSALYVPVCKPDGSFARVQCHNGTGFCWCTSPDGKPESMPAFRITSLEKPNCTELKSPSVRPMTDPKKTGKSHLIAIFSPQKLLEQKDEMYFPRPIRQKSKDRRRKKSKSKKVADKQNPNCSGKSRNSFIKKMLNSFKKGFNNRRSSASDDSAEKGGSPSDEEVLRWKFSSLEKKKDNQLTRKEYKQLKKTVKNNIKPAKCAKKFPKMCDIDGDKNISLNEWIKCFESSSPKRKGKEHKTSPRRKKYPIHRIIEIPPVCERERKIAQETYNNVNVTQYVAECDANGQFKPVQCYGTEDKWYCFCVHKHTGEMVDNTSVPKDEGPPDCSGIVYKWPGCPDEVRFVETMIQYMLDENSFLENSTTIPIIKPPEEEIVRTFFMHIDKNENNLIEKKEGKLIRRFVKRDRLMKKCGRRLVKVCDSNKDRNLSLEEWMKCITTKAKPEDSSKAPRINGTNPFIEYLQPEN